MWKEEKVDIDLFDAEVEEVKICEDKIRLKLRLPREAEVELDLPEFEKILLKKFPLSVEASVRLVGDAVLKFSSANPLASVFRSLYRDAWWTKDMLEKTAPEELGLLAEFLTAVGSTSELRKLPKELWPKVAKARLMKKYNPWPFGEAWYVRRSYEEPFRYPRWQNYSNYYAATVLRNLTAWFRFEHYEFREPKLEEPTELWLCDDDLPVLLANMMVEKKLFHKKDLLPIVKALDAGDIEKARALILSRAFWR